MEKRIFDHIAFWIAYVFFKVYLNTEAYQGIGLSVSVLSQLAFLLVKVPMIYTLFYITEKYLVKKWSLYKASIAVALLIITGIFAYLLVRQEIVFTYIYKVQYPWKESFVLSNLLYTIFVLAFPCSIAIALKLIRSNIRQREAKQEITKRKLETELQFLKAQINPHFLFNTFSNIYSLARRRSEQTANAIMKLSELFRFILYESQKKYISIADEIQVLEHYIELESIRYDDNLQIAFTRSIDNNAQPIAPLILLPFVENTFKHGASESLSGSYIAIDLKLHQKQLYFTCENSKAETGYKNGTEKIGLMNIRRQLELLYPEHTLNIENTATRFKVSLNINLSSNSVAVV